MDGVFDRRDHHVLKGVYSPGGQLNLLIKGEERGLQGGDVDDYFEQLFELFSGLLDGGGSSVHSDVAAGLILLVSALDDELRQRDTSNVVFAPDKQGLSSGDGICDLLPRVSVSKFHLLEISGGILGLRDQKISSVGKGSQILLFLGGVSSSLLPRQGP